jgi:hypothetical protein
MQAEPYLKLMSWTWSCEWLPVDVAILSSNIVEQFAVAVDCALHVLALADQSMIHEMQILMETSPIPCSLLALSSLLHCQERKITPKSMSQVR